jgi:FkbM family methyltransferase
MKLNEALHTGRLPHLLRKNVWRYALRKTFGIRYSDEEKESNLALRVVSKSDASIEKVDGYAMIWKLSIFGTKLTLQTRRYPSSDLGILFQVLCKQEYLPAVEILRRKQPTRPVTILDAGANVGFSALYFKAAFPDCQLVCLEIDDSNFKQLKANMAPWKNVTLEKHALWKRPAYLTIAKDFRDQAECSYYPVESETPTSLQGFPISHFVKKAGWDRIDLLKIDIEGSERFLFENPALAEEVLTLTDLIAIEIHDEYNIRETICGYLTKHGFQHFEHGDLTIAHR